MACLKIDGKTYELDGKEVEVARRTALRSDGRLDTLASPGGVRRATGKNTRKAQVVFVGETPRCVGSAERGTYSPKYRPHNVERDTGAVFTKHGTRVQCRCGVIYPVLASA